MLLARHGPVHHELVEGCIDKPFMLRQAQHERLSLKCPYNDGLISNLDETSIIFGDSQNGAKWIHSFPARKRKRKKKLSPAKKKQFPNQSRFLKGNSVLHPIQDDLDSPLRGDETPARLKALSEDTSREESNPFLKKSLPETDRKK